MTATAVNTPSTAVNGAILLFHGSQLIHLPQDHPHPMRRDLHGALALSLYSYNDLQQCAE